MRKIMKARFENFEGKTIEKFYIFDKVGEGINNVGNEIGAGLVILPAVRD